MPKYIMLALNGPVEGQDKDYNDWYDTTHLPELLKIPEVVAGRRYKTVGGKMPGGVSLPYVAVYEIETDNLPAILEKLGTQLSPFSPSFDRKNSASIIAVEI